MVLVFFTQKGHQCTGKFTFIQVMKVTIGLNWPIHWRKIIVHISPLGDSNEYPQHMFLWRNICCGYSLESPRRGDSNEHPQHMFFWRTRENCLLIITKYPPHLTLYNLVSFLFTAGHDTDGCRINTMLQLHKGKKIIFWAFRINFEELLLVEAFDNISIVIFLRQSAFDSVWHFRKSVQNSFVKVWQVEKFLFETE